MAARGAWAGAMKGAWPAVGKPRAPTSEPIAPPCVFLHLNTMPGSGCVPSACTPCSSLGLSPMSLSVVGAICAPHA